jgi:putative ABC transport system ATP-binding protein
LIDGIDFAKLSDSRRTVLRKTKIGFVFQKFNLLPTLTARQKPRGWVPFPDRG